MIQNQQIEVQKHTLFLRPVLNFELDESEKEEQYVLILSNRMKVKMRSMY